MSKIYQRPTSLRTQTTQKRQNKVNETNIRNSLYYSQPKNNNNSVIFLKTRLKSQPNPKQPSNNPQTKYQQPHYLTIVPKGSKVQTIQTQSLKEPKHYEIQKLIGKGTFGSVFSGLDLKSSKKIAIKKTFQDKYYKNRELSILKELHHPNIIQLLDYYTQIQNNKAFFYIVTDLFSKDLHSCIQKQKIAEDILPLYIYQILRALQHLNQKSIAHRDLKPHNILVNKMDHRIALCDFGSAKKIHQNDKNIAYICGRCYRAPQLVFGANYYTTAVDMWSLGCIIFQMINRKPLFNSQSSSALLIDIMKLLGTPTPSQINQMNPQLNKNQYQNIPYIKRSSLTNILMSKNVMLIDLLQKLLVYSPNERLSPSQALEHQYFNRLTPSYMNHLGQKYIGIIDIFDQGSLRSKRKVVDYKIKDKSFHAKTLYQTLSTEYSDMKHQEDPVKPNFNRTKKSIIKKLF